MFYQFLVPLADDYRIFNVLRYLTFRTGGAVMTALLICFVIGPAFIRRLKLLQGKGQPIRDDGPQRHIVEKQGTPTMGGLLILVALVLSTLLWVDLSNLYVWAVLLVTFSFSLLGFMDDYLVTKRTSAGISARRSCSQLVVAGRGVLRCDCSAATTVVAIPFAKGVLLQLGWGYILFGALVIVGSSNAVNLTDGLDGLAIVPVMIAAATFLLIAYLVGNIRFADYLQINYVPGTGELAILLGALIGAGLGFLWFNAPPAMVFMGDGPALALGGVLGATAVAIKHEIVLVIVGGLFVMEAVSVMVQVISFKTTGKRVFRMAPIHHHFEQLHLARTDHRHPLLDHLGDLGAGRPFDAKLRWGRR